MGYSVDMVTSQFRIAAANKGPALAALQQLAATESHIAWVELRRVAEARSLADAIDEFGWSVEIDDLAGGDLVGIRFEAEKIGDEDKLFGALAPFVQAGSFIEMRGEDGEAWRWVFDGQTCAEVRGAVRFDGAHTCCEHVGELQTDISFLLSVIRSGEGWSEAIEGVQQRLRASAKAGGRE